MQERQRFQALSYEAQPVDLFQRLLPFSFTKSDRYNCSSQRKSAVSSYRPQAAFSPDGVNVRLDAIFEPFVQHSPVSVTVRGLMERVRAWSTSRFYF